MLISRWKAPATPVGEVSWEGGVLGGKVWPLEEMALRGAKLGDWEGVRSWVPKAQLIILTDAVLLFHSLSLVVPICGFLSLTFIFTSWPWFLLCTSSSMAHSMDLAHERDSGALALYRSLQKTDTSADWKCCQALKNQCQATGPLGAHANTHLCNGFFPNCRRRCRIIRPLASLVSGCCPHHKH